ncbi:MAG: MauE/DoxX family redox-associated membrane protein [Pseudomonadota bacterium]
MNNKVLKWSYPVIRWAIAITFVYAGASKLPDTEAFSELIGAYGLVPESMVPIVAILLPILEILAGIGLVFDLRGSLFVITALLLLFIGVLGYADYLGFNIDCGCFSPGDPEAKAFHGLRAAILKDGVLVGCAAYLYIWRIKTSHSPINIFGTTFYKMLQGDKP